MIKKQIQIMEALEEPVIGERARIKVGNQVLLTSPVEKWHENIVTGEMRIETRNTIYYK